MAYKAVIASVDEVRPIEGADKIQVAIIGSYPIIVGKDVQPGDIMCVMEQGGQLSEEFAKTHDLIKRKDPVTGKQAGGFFDTNRRVKAISMKGVRSEGFACPLSLFAYTGYDISTFKIGDQFDELNGKPICNKYVTKATRQRMAGNKQRKKRTWQTKMFAEHIDTGHFRREAHNIPAGALIHLSVKLHGTSHRIAHAVVEREHRGLRAIMSKIFRRPLSSRSWELLHGTRRTVLDAENKGFYGSHEFRHKSTEGIQPDKGEVIYGEIVGYVDPEKPIMGKHDISKLKDKSLIKYYGESITYKYGCLPGQSKFYVYRITQVNEDGKATDLSWYQVVQRCNELGLETVPHIDSFIYDGDLEKLRKYVGELVDGDPNNPKDIPSRLDASHIEEGVVVRYECPWGTGWLKHKAFLFGVLEGYQKEDELFVDIEEAEELSIEA